MQIDFGVIGIIIGIVSLIISIIIASVKILGKLEKLDDIATNAKELPLIGERTKDIKKDIHDMNTTIMDGLMSAFKNLTGTNPLTTEQIQRRDELFAKGRLAGLNHTESEELKGILEEGIHDIFTGAALIIGLALIGILIAYLAKGS